MRQPPIPADIDRLDQLQQAVSDMAAGRPLASEAVEWLAPAFQAYIDHGGDLARHLGLRVRPGGAFELPHTARRMAKRDQYLVLLVNETPGDRLRPKARRAADFLHGRGPAPNPLAKFILERLRSLKAPIPEEERLVQICSGRARRARRV